MKTQSYRELSQGGEKSEIKSYGGVFDMNSRTWEEYQVVKRFAK